MYKSATIKLTAWYLLILMSISLLFSVIIYRVAESEINTRFESIQQRLQRDSTVFPLPGVDFRALRTLHARESAVNLFVSLLYTNILILVGGGIGSYMLARRTLQPIERSYEAQSRFTSDASHELRTPLAVMKAELEVALRDPKLSNSEMKEILASNLEEVDKLTKLAQTLLQLSRLDHVSLKTGKVAIGNITQNVIKKYDKTGARIHLSKPPQPVYTKGNEVSLEELVTILVDNAIKYSPDDSVVDIIIAKKNRQAVFTVKNAGEGIDESDLPHIFDRFYRIDSSRTNSSRDGYGLGLSLAKKIVELHNGDLSASSARGQETTFTVKLPLYSKNNTQKTS